MASERDEQSPASAACPLHAALEALSRLRPEAATDIGALESGWRTAREVYCDHEAIETMLAAQAAFTTDLDRKAQAAYLVIDQSMMVSTVCAAPWLAAGVVPQIATEVVALRLHFREVGHGGRTVEELKTGMRLLRPAFVTADRKWSGHREGRFLPERDLVLDGMRRMIEGYFQPLIRRLHAATALPEQAMWRLVGDSVGAVFLDVGRHLGCEEQAKRDALVVLKQAGSPLANRQLHYFDIVVREGGDTGRILATRSFRSRGGCCRYYTSREGRLCTTCVLLDPGVRDRNLEAMLRSRLSIPRAGAISAQTS